MRLLLAVAASVIGLSPARAGDRCLVTLPQGKGITIGVEQLLEDDRAIWQRLHARDCPGFATLHSGGIVYRAYNFLKKIDRATFQIVEIYRGERLVYRYREKNNGGNFVIFSDDCNTYSKGKAKKPQKYECLVVAHFEASAFLIDSSRKLPWHEKQISE